MTVDGTDFRCCEQQDRPTSWYSFKFNGPAVKYEVAIGSLTGNIVWVSDMYRGAVHDITIFRAHLKDMLALEEEKAIADLGYRGRNEADTIDLPEHGSAQWQQQKSRARARHETCNRRFKSWSVMQHRFRHSNIMYHQDCFHAVAVLTQLRLENGDALFDVGDMNGDI